MVRWDLLTMVKNNGENLPGIAYERPVLKYYKYTCKI